MADCRWLLLFLVGTHIFSVGAFECELDVGEERFPGFKHLTEAFNYAKHFDFSKARTCLDVVGDRVEEEELRHGAANHRALKAAGRYEEFLQLVGTGVAAIEVGTFLHAPSNHASVASKGFHFDDNLPLIYVAFMPPFDQRPHMERQLRMLADRYVGRAHFLIGIKLQANEAAAAMKDGSFGKLAKLGIPTTGDPVQYLVAEMDQITGFQFTRTGRRPNSPEGDVCNAPYDVTDNLWRGYLEAASALTIGVQLNQFMNGRPTGTYFIAPRAFCADVDGVPHGQSGQHGGTIEFAGHFGMVDDRVVDRFIKRVESIRHAFVPVVDTVVTPEVADVQDQVGEADQGGEGEIVENEEESDEEQEVPVSVDVLATHNNLNVDVGVQTGLPAGATPTGVSGLKPVVMFHHLNRSEITNNKVVVTTQHFDPKLHSRQFFVDGDAVHVSLEMRRKAQVSLYGMLVVDPLHMQKMFKVECEVLSKKTGERLAYDSVLLHVSAFPVVASRKIFSEEEVRAIRRIADSQLRFNRAGLEASSGSKQLEIRQSEVDWVSGDRSIMPKVLKAGHEGMVPNMLQWVFERIRWAGKKLNAELWQMDIGEPEVNMMQFTRYTAGGDKYDYHVDTGEVGLASRRRLSVTVQLSSSDEYEGGELQVTSHDVPYNCSREIGVANFFPSFYLHRVTGVSAGTRYSIVAWFHAKDP